MNQFVDKTHSHSFVIEMHMGGVNPKSSFARRCDKLTKTFNFCQDRQSPIIFSEILPKI